ncbi:hypothetical protein EYV94_03575 [Puteibacter caeruleilacunae]|nr:hypothetical protein EYV94_03575 [Puteibacter caeruleilacunae]
MSEVLLSTAYMAPVQYFSKILKADTVVIEQFENFTKQTWRNRCRIVAANGVQDLTIPVQKGRNRKILIKDIRLSYETNWQHQHWQSIISAYNSSPFFEYYVDEFAPFFDKKYDFLMDLNQDLLEIILEQLEIYPEIKMTDDFIPVTAEANSDYRFAFSPKSQNQLPDPAFSPVEYTQVFSDKRSFEPNLSILDLLFNTGPDTYDYLEKSITE